MGRRVTDPALRTCSQNAHRGMYQSWVHQVLPPVRPSVLPPVTELARWGGGVGSGEEGSGGGRREERVLRYG